MAEERQGPNGPHALQAHVNPLDRPEREDQDPEDLVIGGISGTAPALADESTE